MKNWNSYSPKEKVKLMQIFIRNGITDLNQMQEYINSFDINTKKNLNGLDSTVQTLNKPTPTTYTTGGEKQSVEMTPSKAEELNKKLDTSQYMLAVGSSPEDPAYLSPGYLEPATVKAFDSQEDYNRHIGDKFGEYVSNSISNAGTKLAPVLAGTAAFPFALNLGMAAYANPFVRSTLDMIGAIDGARNFSSDNGIRKTIRLAKEGDTWGAVKSGIGDVFDIAGITDLIRIGSRFNKANRALHAYDAISPEGYDNPGKRFKTWFADIVNDKPVDIDNPQWKIKGDGFSPGSAYLTNSASNYDAGAKIYREARVDAWRMYNGLPQKYGTYIKNADGTYSYDLDRIKKIDPNFSPGLDGRIDDITGAGGGLTHDQHKLLGSDGLQNKHFYVRTIEDIWDLHPFSRPENRLNAKANKYLKNKIGTQKFRDAAQNFRSYMYEKGHWNYGPRTLLGKATYFLDSPLNRYRTGMRSIRNPDGTILDYKYFTPTADNLIDKFTNSKLINKISDKLANIEAGTIIGGTPFKMHTEIPITGHLKFTGIQKGDINAVMKTRLGFQSDNILPWAVKNYGRYDFNFSDLEKRIDSFNDIYKIPNLSIYDYRNGGKLNILESGNEEEQTLSGEGYIQTNQADLSDVETFNRNWYKYRDTQLANAIKDNYDAYFTEGLNFLQKGFPQWTDQTKVANAARNYINKRLDTVTEFDSREALKDLKTRSWLEDEYYNIFPNRKPNLELIGPPKPVSDSDLKFITEFLYNGVYNPKTHSIVYNKEHEKSSTKVHERAHASVPMITGVSRSPLLAPILKVQLMDTVKADPTYYDAVDEIYARLMQLRFANNLDPTHTYTLDEVKAMRNDSKFKDYGIFNRYTDESILLLLNEVAQNTTDSTKLNYVNPDNIAAYGGKLNTLENGGDKDNSYIPNIFLDPLSLVSFNKSNDNKLGVPYRDFNSSDYSYYDANKNNMPTEKGGHWTSRNNETGQILKSPDHPTFINELIEGLKKGYVPYENPIDSLFYSTPKPTSYPDIPMKNLNERYNIFEDDKANNSKKAHRESLDKFIKNNPTLYGLNTADFADFFSQLAGLEGSYKKDAGKGMIYSGYYGLKDGSDDTEDEQHKRAFKHLAGLFQNSIVKEDILKGLSLGYSPAQILAKYWNQGNRVTQFLWNGVNDTDGVGTKISDYGWNITADADYLKYLKDAITEDEVKVKDVKSLNEAIVRVRKPGINYSNREADILKFNRDRNKKFDTKKLKVGDTIYLTPLPKK